MLRIAQINDLWFRIPPQKYGGAERIVSILTEGLVKNGNEVTLYAVGDSKTSAKLASIIKQGLSESGMTSNIIYPTLNFLEAIEHEKDYDILHFHLNLESDYLALPMVSKIKNKCVFTVHFTAPSFKDHRDRDIFLRKFSDLNYISISNAQRRGMEYLNWIDTVYNSVDLKDLTFNPTPKDYFLWLGKLHPNKGPHEAILAAKKVGVKLILSGAMDHSDEIDEKYYNEQILPYIDDDQIIFRGEIDTDEKNTLYGNAKGFLNPIQWNEPFGLVMAEAMACGTPVISFDNGAASEVIEDGKTGFLVDDISEMAEKIKDIDTIDRAYCRKRIEQNFSPDVMVKNYEETYQKLLHKNLSTIV